MGLPGSVEYSSGSACVLTYKGAVYCWHLGSDSDQIGSSAPKPLTGGLVFKQLSMADFYTCGVSVNGGPSAGASTMLVNW